MKFIVQGTGASPGKAIGPARIVQDSSQINKIKEGDILIAHTTNPAYTIAMHKAVGIVTDVGGICSHACIVARELGVPCIVGAVDATQKIKDGEILMIDGEKGNVYRKD